MEISVSEVLDKLGIKYNEKGNKYSACCPFHSEKTPSFYIFKEGGSFNCFGCGKKGNLNDLTKELVGQNIFQFLNIKTDYKADFISIKEERKYEPKQLKDVDLIIKGNLYSIFSNQQVLDFCWSIGLTNDFIKTFEISYAKEIKIFQYGTDEKNAKSFYNRIIIPCTFNNHIYNYECRDYTRKSSKKILYPIGSEPDIFFNWDNIDKSKTVFITEGIKGMSKIWSFYDKNVISRFGKVIKENQKNLLRTLNYICEVPDNDENKINKLTNEPIDNIQYTIDAYDEFYTEREFELAYIPYKGLDPNNLSRGQLKEVLDNRKSSKDFIIDQNYPKNKKLKSSTFIDILKS